MRWKTVPLHVETDLALGGRWTSLRSLTPLGEREWLWRNPQVSAAQREAAAPGDAFIDAGGGEECFPSVTPSPDLADDHGDVWARPWRSTPPYAHVAVRGLRLQRRIETDGDAVHVSYRIGASAPTGVLHAVHLLLDLSPVSRLSTTGRPAVDVQDCPAPGLVTQTWWPDGAGVPLDSLGPDDGTARSAVVATDHVDIIDGAHRLSMRWGAPAGTPTSLVVFRNLGGWPAAGPYRSVGVEPLLGREVDRGRASADQLAQLDGEVDLQWWLTIMAATLC